MRILLAILFATSAQAEIIEKHLKPSIRDGFDNTGLWIAAGGTAATLLTAQYLDSSHRDAWRDHQRMNESTSRVGDILGMGIPGVTIALLQLGFDKEAGVAHAEGLTDTFLVTSLLKFTSQRSRPSSDNHQSMPSGHTSITFASATSLSYFYGVKAAVPAYLLATLTAASRWADDAHWLSDTVAGAFIGIFWGRAAALHHLGSLQGTLIPFADTKSAGLLWHMEY